MVDYSVTVMYAIYYLIQAKRALFTCTVKVTILVPFKMGSVQSRGTVYI